MRTFNINADLYNKNYFDYECKQGDDITITLNILENGVASDLTGATFSFNFVKADDTIVSIAGNDITVNNNIVTVICPANCTRAVGPSRAELTIEQASKQATTFDIDITVLPSIVQGQEISRNIPTMVEQINLANISATKILNDLINAINNGDVATLRAIVNSLSNGSPKDVYNNLSELQAAHPNGDKGTYLTSDNGNWWFWDSTQWKSGGVYQSNLPGSKTINTDALADGLLIKRNYEVSGTCNQSESHFCLVYPVKNGLKSGDNINIKYDVLNKLSEQVHVVTKVAYSATDNSDISNFTGISGYLNDYYVSQNTTKTFSCNYTIPSAAYYIKVYITFANMNGLAIDSIVKNIKILNGNNENLLLLPYQNGLINITNGAVVATDYGTRDRLATQTDVARIDGDIQAQKSYFDNKLLSKWSGKTLNVLGDSITAGANTTKTYHAYLKETLGLGIVNNYGINGSTIGWGSDPMCDRSSTMDINADLNVVLGSANDFNLGRPLGTFYTESNGVRTLNFDTGYFRSSLNKLCQNLKNRYPNKTIVICTPLHRGSYRNQPTELQVNSANLYFEVYVQAIRDVCNIWGIPCCDLWLYSGMQPNLPTDAKRYFHDGSDGNEIDELHPNEVGHEQIAMVITQFLNYRV